MSKPAVFIDRDGVINKDKGYVCQVDDFEFIDGVFEACSALKKMGYLIVLVTNQSGIARGMFSEEQFLSLTEWMDWNFSDNGVDFDGIYYCPHHPDFSYNGVAQCDCRKPKPGMFFSARDYLKIDLASSVMIGDKADDLEAARAAGIGLRILVQTGKPVTEQGAALASTILPSIAEVPQFLSGKKLAIN